MTVIERRHYTATGGDSDTLPILLPGLGVPGIANRWASSMLGIIGSSVASWAPYAGSVPLTQSGSAQQPIVGTGPNGNKVLRTDGVDDSLTAGSSLRSAKTIAVLLRVLDPAGTTQGTIGWDGGNIVRGSTGSTSTVRIGAANLVQAASLDQPLFHVVTAINDFAGGIGATVVDGIYGTQATDRENNNLVLGQAGSNCGNIEVLDAAVWDRALTESECQTIRAGYQNAYPGLVA